MKKGRMFYKIFIPILVLGIGLVISFGSYIYMTTNHSVIERVADGKKSLINQIKNTLEQKLKPLNMPSIRTALRIPSAKSSGIRLLNQTFRHTAMSTHS